MKNIKKNNNRNIMREISKIFMRKASSDVTR